MWFTLSFHSSAVEPTEWRMAGRRPWLVCSLQATVALILITQWLSIDSLSTHYRRTQPGEAHGPMVAARGQSAVALWPVEQRMRISTLRLQVPDAPVSNLSTHSVSCPVFSGPGYDAKRHPSHDVTLPEFEAPFASALRPPTLTVDALPLSDVRLLPGSAFHAAFETNLQYLKLLSTDSLLLAWRLTAPGGKWKKGTLRLMGWEHPQSELRGHFLGHWLSATAMAFAATRDPELGHRMAQVVEELVALSAAHGNGYLSAFPSSFLDRLEAISPVRWPFMTGA